MTLAGHLEARARALPWGEPGKTSRQPNITLAYALDSLGTNPNKKALSLDAQRELAALLGVLDAEYEAKWLEMSAVQKEVLLRAITRNNIRSLTHETQMMGSDDIFAVAAASRTNAKDMMTQLASTMREMSSVLGKQMKDWGYTNMATTEPDGVSRNNIVFWTRAEEPAFFLLQDACSQMEKEHYNRVREFIERH